MDKRHTHEWLWLVIVGSLWIATPMIYAANAKTKTPPRSNAKTTTKKSVIAEDRKLLQTAQQQYKKSAQFGPYEKTLVRFRNKYRSAEFDENPKASQDFRGVLDPLYKTLVDSEISRSIKTRKNYDATIALIGRWLLTTEESSPLRETYTLRQADLHTRAQHYAKAVTIYRQVAESQSQPKKISSLRLAVNAQSLLANWPQTAPWKNFKNAMSSAKKIHLPTLKALYTEIKELESPRATWNTVGQIGLMELTAGSQDQAFTLWSEQISKAVDRANAPYALGFIYEAWRKQKNWQKLEDLCRIALKSTLDGMLGTQRILTNAVLADALFFGGKKSFEQNSFTEAATKLKEFVNRWTKDPRRDEGLYLLARSQYGAQQFDQALDSLTDHVNIYTQSKWRESALGLGVEWSGGMAREEKTIFFSRRYLAEFPSQKRARMVARNLIDLFVGREFYADAIVLLKSQSISPKMDFNTRVNAHLEWMDIEDRYGTAVGATAAADSLLKIKNVPNSAKARALLVKARYLIAKKNYKEIDAIDRQLTSIATSSPEAQEALGEIRFSMANVNPNQLGDEIFNLELRDPVGTLNREYSKYSAFKEKFLRVCANGRSSYCAPARLQAAMIADKMIERLQDITIPETLEERVVSQFQKRKDSIITTLSQDHTREIDGAQEYMQRNLTRPDWTQQILWENSTDWNFDRISGEAGNGYVQFEALSTGD